MKTILDEGAGRRRLLLLLTLFSLALYIDTLSCDSVNKVYTCLLDLPFQDISSGFRMCRKGILISWKKSSSRPEALQVRLVLPQDPLQDVATAQLHLLGRLRRAGLSESHPPPAKPSRLKTAPSRR